MRLPLAGLSAIVVAFALITETRAAAPTPLPERIAQVQVNLEDPRPVREYGNHRWHPSDGLCEEIVRRAFEI